MIESIFNIQLILIIVSFIANLFSALAGGGAGLLQFPILIFLGLPFAKALATHKIATVALGLGASISYLQKGTLDKKMSLLVLSAGLPGVVLGGLAIVHVPSVFAKTLLGFLTMGLGIYSLTKKTLGKETSSKHREGVGLYVGLFGLFLIGFLNGSISSGTGLFVTMFLIQWFGFDYKQAVALTLVNVGLWWNFTGAVTLGLLGKTQWDWVFALLLGSFFGGYVGAGIGQRRGNGFIKRVFEILTILVGFRLLRDFIFFLAFYLQ